MGGDILDIALFVPFIEGDIWIERLINSVHYKLRIDEFNDIKSLLEMIRQKPYHAIIVAFENIEAIVIVKKVREVCQEMPLILISDIRPLGISVYRDDETAYIDKDAFDTQIQNILEEYKEHRRIIN